MEIEEDELEGEGRDMALELFSLVEVDPSTGLLTWGFSMDPPMGPPSPSSRVPSFSCFLWAGGLTPETLYWTIRCQFNIKNINFTRKNCFPKFTWGAVFEEVAVLLTFCRIVALHSRSPRVSLVPTTGTCEALSGEILYWAFVETCYKWRVLYIVY